MKRKNATRNALFTSIISMLLCVSMLVGTTFAWFTDEVVSGTNIIAAGNLDIELTHADKGTEGEFKPVNGDTILFDDVALWEPGAVAYEKLTVSNVGDLALKYNLMINLADANGVLHTDGKIYTLADVLKVAVVDADKLTDREAAIAAGKEAGWDKLVSWSESGKLYGEDGKNSDTYGIVIYWEPSANDNIWNLHNGKVTTDGSKQLTIELGVHLTATQLTHENDSYNDQYDAAASVNVSTTQELINAINNAVANTVIYLAPGEYQVTGPIQINKGQTVTLYGTGDVTLKQVGGSHIFNVANSSTATFQNLDLDGNNNQYRNGIYVRENANVTLINTSIKNTGHFDICIDQVSDKEAVVGKTATVKLFNSSVEDVSACAYPVKESHSCYINGAESFVVFTYDSTSHLGSFQKDDFVTKPENITINGSSTEPAFTMYAYNDADLTRILETIKTNEKYWKEEVVVYLAGVEFSGEYVINQYPVPNGNSTDYANKYTNITFVGDAGTVFTGNITVTGSGYSNGGFNKHTAKTTFKNVIFDGTDSIEENGKDYIALYLLGAADDVNFIGCTFRNATHITVGRSGTVNGVGEVNFNECIFNNGNCISGYVETLNINGGFVFDAHKGFINKSKAGKVTVTGVSIDNSGEYVLRTATSGSGVHATFTNVTVGAVDKLVVFRGSNESASFDNCTLPADYETTGVDDNSKLFINGIYTDEIGMKYYYDDAGAWVLYQAQAFTGPALTIPEGVNVLGTKSLQNMTGLKSVTFPSTLTDIGWSTFSGCTSLESVVIPGNVTLTNRTSGSHAHTFAGCTSLTSVTIEEGVSFIPTGCFVNCSALSSIVIPSSVVSLEKKAFYDCLSLETVYLLSEDCEIGYQAFDANKSGYKNMTIYVVNDVMKNKVEASLTGNNKNAVTVEVMNAETASNSSELAETLKNVSATEKTFVSLAAGTYTMPSSAAGKNLTFTGTKDTVISVQNVDTNAGGANVTFVGVTIQGQTSGNYAGYGNGANVHFVDCTFEGKISLYGKNASFTNCTFNNKNDYAVWTWGAEDVDFIGCTFNSGGKALLVYGEYRTANVTIKDCVFNDDDTLNTDKAAIEVGSDRATDNYNITITNTTINGFAENPAGIATGSNVWANKNSMPQERLNVVIDGVDVY